MKKLYLLLIIGTLLSDFAFPQIDSIWVKTAINGNLPTWFSATNNSERGFAYNPVTNHLLIVSRNGGNSIRIVDANTGADLGQMDLTGVDGGTIVINDIEVTADGVIFASNVVVTASETFKVYRWANETAQPTVAFSSNFGGTVGKRLGDNLCLKKSAGDNSMFLALCDNASASLTIDHKIYFLTTANQGVTLSLTKTVTFAPGSFGSFPSVDVVFEDNGDTILVVKGGGKYLSGYTMQGVKFAEIPGSVIGTGSTAVNVLNMPESRSGFVAVFQYGTGMNNARIVDTDGDSYAYWRTYVLTPTTGSNANLNGSGDMDVKYNADGSLTLFVLGTNNGFGAYKLTLPHIVNGRFPENYQWAGEKLNTNSGFGSAIDVSEILYDYDFAKQKLHIAARGKLDKTNGNGIVLFLSVSKMSAEAAPAGTSLGGVANGGHLFGATSNPNFKMDFPVNFAFVINPGATDSVVYLDAAQYTGVSKNGAYIGMARMDGRTAYGPGPGSFFPENSIAFAFDSAYGKNRGLEISIPMSVLGNPTSADNIRLFAAVVSNSAYFSDVTVPGSITGGNPGFNPNFQTLPGGPYNSGIRPLPVELKSFSATGGQEGIKLTWSTATETNNKGFEVERSSDGINYQAITFVNGAGNSVSAKTYDYFDKPERTGTYYYRLKQTDFDGSYSLSSVISADYTIAPAVFALEQNYPNPFNPVTMISYQLSMNSNVSLKVYDMLGNEAAVLVNGYKEAGNHSVSFNASKLSSGIYFYKLTQGEKTITRKLVLMK